MLDFENAQNPFGERQEAIKNWMSFCTIDIVETITLLEKAKHLLTFGIKPKDAIHIAAAIEANADYFLTTDDRLLGKAILVYGVKLINPTEFVKVLDNYDN